jgi:hypothetical protein
MKFVPSRQLSARPGKVWEDLKREGAIVITKDGIPFGIMIPTSDATMVDDVEELVFARAGKAVRAIRSQASREGLDRLPAEEIDAEIRRARTRRQGRRHRG